MVFQSESDILVSIRIRVGLSGRPVVQVQYAARRYEAGRMSVEGVMPWRDAKRSDTVEVARWFERVAQGAGQ